jgi:hypothetical protein
MIELCSWKSAIIGFMAGYAFAWACLLIIFWRRLTNPRLELAAMKRTVRDLEDRLEGLKHLNDELMRKDGGPCGP